MSTLTTVTTLPSKPRRNRAFFAPVSSIPCSRNYFLVNTAERQNHNSLCASAALCVNENIFRAFSKSCRQVYYYPSGRIFPRRTSRAKAAFVTLPRPFRRFSWWTCRSRSESDSVFSERQPSESSLHRCPPTYLESSATPQLENDSSKSPIRQAKQIAAKSQTQHPQPSPARSEE